MIVAYDLLWRNSQSGWKIFHVNKQRMRFLNWWTNENGKTIRTSSRNCWTTLTVSHLVNARQSASCSDSNCRIMSDSTNTSDDPVLLHINRKYFLKHLPVMTTPRANLNTLISITINAATKDCASSVKNLSNQKATSRDWWDMGQMKGNHTRVIDPTRARTDHKSSHQKHCGTRKHKTILLDTRDSRHKNESTTKRWLFLVLKFERPSRSNETHFSSPHLEKCCVVLPIDSKKKSDNWRQTRVQISCLQLLMRVRKKLKPSW